MLLSQFLVSYSLQRELTDSSVEQYRIAINSLSKHLGREAVIEDLLPDAINLYLRELAAHRAPHTVKSKRRSLMVLWRAAVEQGMTTQLPRRIRVIKTPETPKDVWSAEQVAGLVSVLERRLDRLPQILIKAADYYSGLLRAAWETGLRLGDLMQLERQHVAESGWFSVTLHKTGLTHFCRLHETTRQIILRTYDEVAPPRKLCWPTWGQRCQKTCYKQMRAEIGKAMAELGLTASDGVFKKLRRSSITAVEIAAPGQGQHQAGHTTPITTQKWYLSSAVKLNRPLPEELSQSF